MKHLFSNFQENIDKFRSIKNLRKWYISGSSMFWHDYKLVMGTAHILFYDQLHSLPL